MSEMIAICGLICTECPTYLATQKNDDDERQKVAEQWSKLFKMKIEPDDINCDGCLSESERHFNYCTVCKIRQCGKGKGVQNCAYCADYPCTLLEQWFINVPESKTTLNSIRERL